MPPGPFEAVNKADAGRDRTLRRVRLSMAPPTVMVGVDRSVMLSVFVPIVVAFIGTQELRQQMHRAPPSASVGDGLVPRGAGGLHGTDDRPSGDAMGGSPQPHARLGKTSTARADASVPSVLAPVAQGASSGGRAA